MSNSMLRSGAVLWRRPCANLSKSGRFHDAHYDQRSTRSRMEISKAPQSVLSEEASMSSKQPIQISKAQDPV